MTAQEQIAKLESLLERIRRNAERPRAVAARAEPVARAVPVAEPVAPPRLEPVAVPRVEQVTAPRVEPTAIAEEVSLESLGATEASAPAAEVPRERVQSADMEDLEIVELASDIVELGPGQSLEEPVPESAPRAAVQSVEVELEPPIKTPPPESGRQAVTPPPAIAESRAIDDDFDEDDLLETDTSGSPISIVNPSAPTMAQLGDTVQIEGATGPVADIELAAPPVPARSAATDELEAELPKQRGAAGAFDAALAPPSTAGSDLQRHREVPPEPTSTPSRRVDPLAATVPDLRSALPFAQTVPDARSPFADAIRATTQAKAETPAPKEVAAKAAAPAPAATAPELVVERPASAATHAAEIVVEKPRKVPETFLELLDASLELRV